MSRTVSAALASHLATRSHTRCWMLLLILRDGTSIGITDHTQAIDFSLPEESGTVTYSANSGFRISDVTQPAGLDPGSYEVTGPIGSIVTRQALLGGRWNRAVAYLFQVNWKAPTAALDIMKGAVCGAKPNGGEFTFEIRDDRDGFNQTVGSTITPYCQGTHATCCVQIAPETNTTITSASSALTFNIAATLDPDDHRDGRLWFTTGALAGTEPREIYAISGNTVTLFAPLADTPAIGDELTVKEGCDRTRATCLARFDNVIEFRGGYPETSGSDQILRMPIPGQGND
jgi:uncharacterized phage protein (TIGR02218 family)